MFISKVLFIVVLANPIFANNNSLANIYTSYHDKILCRSCGHDIATTKHIIAKASPNSQYSFYDTIFNRQQDVLVQILTDLLVFHFPVVTFTESTCSGVGEWAESSFFPGYLTRPCICPECGGYVGWEYELNENLASAELESFFGLILPNIISESFADSLVQHPTIQN